MGIAIPARLLRGLLHILSPRARYYLNGIYVDTQNQALVATDGHAMIVAQLSLPQFEPSGASLEGFILPAPLIQAALKLATVEAPDLTVDIAPHSADAIGESRPGSRMLIVRGSEGELSGEEIDARFPHWTQVIPDNVSEEPAEYHTRWLEKVRRALSAASAVPSKNLAIKLATNGSHAALITCTDMSLMAVLMPANPKAEKLPIVRLAGKAQITSGLLKGLTSKDAIAVQLPQDGGGSAAHSAAQPPQQGQVRAAAKRHGDQLLPPYAAHYANDLDQHTAVVQTPARPQGGERVSPHLSGPTQEATAARPAAPGPAAQGPSLAEPSQARASGAEPEPILAEAQIQREQRRGQRDQWAAHVSEGGLEPATLDWVGGVGGQPGAPMQTEKPSVRRRR